MSNRMTARPEALVRALSLADPPTSVLRRLRGEPGLVGLVGAWAGGGAILGCRPAEIHAGDPFEPPDRWGGELGPAGAFGGGWIGLWGYQLNRLLEDVPPSPPRPQPQPDSWIARYDWVIRYAAATGQWCFETLLVGAAAESAYDVALRLVAQPEERRPFTFDAFAMTSGADRYREAVAAAREHIWAGDIFQANICTRFDSRLHGDPLDVFCAGVDALSPDHAAYLDTGERQVVSLSPELFLRRTGRETVTRPIKGTAPASQDPDLLDRSAKDRAENVMIVDLMRNDLGRVSATGTVRVTALAEPESGAGVRHLVSEVRGTLTTDASDADLLRATFPPGSVTGAPKVRAMEVIHELVATGREVYTGAIGYVSPLAGLETSVVIRTFEVAGRDCWIGVGGGIVADSEPDRELAEVFTKIDPLLAALGATRSTTAAPLPLPVDVMQWDVADAEGPRPDPALGIFDTLLVRDGEPVALSAHVARLADSVDRLYDVPVDRDALAERIRTDSSVITTARVRTSYDPTEGDWVIETLAIDEPGLEPRTLAVRRLPGGLGEHKWRDRRLVVDTGTADDLLLVDEAGHLLEAGRANVFVVLDDVVVTPPLDDRILPGTTRARAISLLHDHRIPALERPVSIAELASAVEVFTTSSIRGVQPVVGCEGVATWPVGSLTSWLSDHLDRVTEPASGPAVPDGLRVLVLDNYDSFTYNLAQRLGTFGADVDVVRNDRATVENLVARAGVGEFTHLVVSPGPGRPEDAGISVEAIAALGDVVPVLGVCLGHQCIGLAYGASVVRSGRPVHGRRSLVHHDGRGVYAGLGAPFAAGRYHSLVVTDLPDDLVATAYTGDGVLMGLRHRTLPVEGVQLHPESILTDLGDVLLAGFLSRDRR
jgi:para-aminobenzoate synthetase/4-amino-4-deoxychorismate lyase